MINQKTIEDLIYLLPEDRKKELKSFTKEKRQRLCEVMSLPKNTSQKYILEHLDTMFAIIKG